MRGLLAGFDTELVANAVAGGIRNGAHDADDKVLVAPPIGARRPAARNRPLNYCECRLANLSTMKTEGTSGVSSERTSFALNATDIPNVAYTHVFPAPLLIHHWAENVRLNRELRELILSQADKTRGEIRTNVGGWHSETAQLEFLGEAGRALMAQMLALVEAATRRLMTESCSPASPLEWGFAGWANICREGDSHFAHAHAGSTWSGVYYVDAGDVESAESGSLQLVDPCTGRANTFFPFLLPQTLLVRPQAGLMVLFPSYIAHTVLGYRGGGTRISVAFNFRKRPFP